MKQYLHSYTKKRQYVLMLGNVVIGITNLGIEEFRN